VQKHLASAVGALIVASITWTALLLKKRWFNSYIADSTAADDGAEGPEVRPRLTLRSDSGTEMLLLTAAQASRHVAGVLVLVPFQPRARC
jgi:hypothetical protein